MTGRSKGEVELAVPLADVVSVLTVKRHPVATMGVPVLSVAMVLSNGEAVVIETSGFRIKGMRHFADVLESAAQAVPGEQVPDFSGGSRRVCKCPLRRVRRSAVGERSRNSPSPISVSTSTPSNPHQNGARRSGSVESVARYPTCAGILGSLGRAIPGQPDRGGTVPKDDRRCRMATGRLRGRRWDGGASADAGAAAVRKRGRDHGS